MNRPYMNVNVWSHTPSGVLQFLACFVVSHTLDNISAIMPNSNGVSQTLTLSQFDEWHSFAVFCGHEIDYIICDDTYQETARYHHNP